MSLHVYGVTDSLTAQAITADEDLADRRLSAVHALGLAVLLGPAPKAPLFQSDRVKALKRLVLVQETLEGVMRHGPVMAVTPGAEVTDEDDALRFLAANVGRLRAAFQEFGAKVQFQISIKWDPAKALERAREHDDFGDIRRLAERGDRKALGRAIQRAMETERLQLSERYSAMIAAAAEDVIKMPLETADDVVNLVALVESADELHLDRAVEAIDASWSDGLLIQYVGPLPALSFASVALDRPDPRQLAAAGARLGVSALAEPEDVRSAYRTRMKQVHPDRALAAAGDVQDAPRDMGDAQEAADDYRLLLRVSEARAALIAFTRGAPDPASHAAAEFDAPPLAVVRRDGGVAQAA